MEAFPGAMLIGGIHSLAKRHLIVFILAGAFALRVYGIRSPLIGHAQWRQADTAAIACNYYENGYSFLYPQVDWGGNTPGYCETEFPVYSFAVALLYALLGVSEIFGRLLSIVFSLAGIYSMYLLVRRCVDDATAFWSATFLSILPLNVYYGRTFMPESALLMSSVFGILFFFRWLASEKWSNYFASVFFTSMACLIKIPTLYIGLPLAYLAYVRYGKGLWKQRYLWLYGFLVILPVVLWYFHAHQIFRCYGLTFGIWEYGTDKWGNWDLVVTSGFWDRIINRSVARAHLVKYGFPLLVIGLLLKRRSRDEWVFDFWLVAIFMYFIIVAKGNYVHKYYQLPFVLPASVYMGKVFARGLDRTVFRNRSLRWLVRGALMTCLAIIAYRSVRDYRSFIREENPPWSDVFELSERVKEKTGNDARIIAVDKGDPTILYLSHRKGWHAHPHDVNASFINERSRLGAKYIVGIRADFSDEEAQRELARLLSGVYPVPFCDDRLFIVDMADRNASAF